MSFSQRVSPHALLSMALLVLCLAVYFPVADQEFVNYDDPMYVMGNPVVLRGLTLEGLKWAFTTTLASNWHPLTWISHMADVEFFGPVAGSHKLVSVGFHSVNSLLIFLLLCRSTGKPFRSFFVAALFAVHPLNVESVAWVAERKNVLCGFFWLLAAGAYGRYVRRPGTARYLTMLLLFVAALLSKPMAVTFPFSLLLLDIWPLGRAWKEADASGNLSHDFSAGRFRHLVREKIPIFLLAAGFSAVTYLVQDRGYAVSSIQETDWGIRASNATLSYARYLGKTVWPTSLGIHYPLPPDAVPGGWVLGAGILLLFLTFVFVARARSRPWLAIGWFWFLGTLVPVIGLVQAGTQAMADRYMYVPLMGLLVGAVWEISEAIPRRGPVAGTIVALGVGSLLFSAILARDQIRYWKTSLDLFRHGAEVSPGSAVSWVNLGAELLEKGEVSEAEGYFRKAIRIRPDYPLAHYDLAESLRRRGRITEAVLHYREALRLGEQDPMIRKGAKNALLNLGVNPAWK